jgi:hypothetical protein
MSILVQDDFISAYIPIINFTGGNVVCVDYKAILQTEVNSNISINFDTTNLTKLDNSSAYYCYLNIKMLENIVSIVWPTNLIWENNEAPSIENLGIYKFVFSTEDGGTTWIGNKQFEWVPLSTVE